MTSIWIFWIFFKATISRHLGYKAINFSFRYILYSNRACILGSTMPVREDSVKPPCHAPVPWFGIDILSVFRTSASCISRSPNAGMGKTVGRNLSRLPWLLHRKSTQREGSKGNWPTDLELSLLNMFTPHCARPSVLWYSRPRKCVLRFLRIDKREALQSHSTTPSLDHKHHKRWTENVAKEIFYA